MSERTVTVPIRAVTKGRPRLGRRRKAYTPARTLEFEAAVSEAWDAVYSPENDTQGPITGPCGMQVIIGSGHIEITVWELEESARPKYITGDVDNYVKSILDALNGHAYVDDKQIHHFEVFLTKENPEETNDEEA